MSEQRKPTTNFPNLQKSVETTIPLISSILMGLVGGFFVANSVATYEILNYAVRVRILPVIPSLNFLEFNMIGEVSRRYWIMFFCIATLIFLYLCVENCILSQMSNCEESENIYPKNDYKDQWEECEINRDIYAQKSIIYYNIGLRIAPVPFVFHLPDEIFALGGFVIICYWVVQARTTIYQYQEKKMLIQKRKALLSQKSTPPSEKTAPTSTGSSSG